MISHFLTKKLCEKIILKLLSLAFAAAGLGQKISPQIITIQKAMTKIHTQSSGSCFCDHRPVAQNLTSNYYHTKSYDKDSYSKFWLLLLQPQAWGTKSHLKLLPYKKLWQRFILKVLALAFAAAGLWHTPWRSGRAGAGLYLGGLRGGHGARTRECAHVRLRLSWPRVVGTYVRVGERLNIWLFHDWQHPVMLLAEEIWKHRTIIVGMNCHKILWTKGNLIIYWSSLLISE